MRYQGNYRTNCLWVSLRVSRWLASLAGLTYTRRGILFFFDNKLQLLCTTHLLLVVAVVVVHIFCVLLILLTKIFIHSIDFDSSIVWHLSITKNKKKKNKKQFEHKWIKTVHVSVYQTYGYYLSTSVQMRLSFTCILLNLNIIIVILPLYWNRKK